MYKKVVSTMKMDEQFRAPLSWFPNADARRVVTKLRTGNIAPKTVFNKYPIFVINVVCPPEDYDITTDPTKTLVEFKVRSPSSSFPFFIFALLSLLFSYIFF